MEDKITDRREEILDNNWSSGLVPNNYPDSIIITRQDIYNAMDEYMRECVIEFIDYVAKNRIEINNFNGETSCYLPNGEGITKEQLFENFL